MARARKYYVGYSGTIEDGSKYEIIKIIDHHRCVVKFDTGNIKEVDLTHFRCNTLKNNIVGDNYGD